SCHGSSRCWNISCATRARWFRARCCCNTSGICTLTPPPTSSTSMSDGSDARSTVSKPTRSSTPSAGSGFASVLLAATLRQSPLNRVLIFIGIFGAAVLSLFGYVYWSTASFVLGRADQAIAAEHAALQRIHESAGRAGVATTIEQRLTVQRVA